MRGGPFGRRQKIILNLRKIEPKTLKFPAGPLDIRAVLHERQTAWRVPELTRLLSLGDHTLYDAIASGQLPASRVGTTIRISPIDALTYFEARTTSK
jgi:excisionase family DNA binding protein